MSTAAEGIYAFHSSYLERAVQLGIAGSKVISVSFPDAVDPDAGDDHPLIDRIERYLDGFEEDVSNVEVGLTVPTDQRAVLQKVRTIPYGQQVSVEQLARMTPAVDPGEDQNVVRTALVENPSPLLIPDHRVRNGPSGAPPKVERRLRSIEGL
jgi:methylated-DNA-[protein]-cysteine S-methyltransferase